MPRYAVTHLTRYRYDEPVVPSYGQHHLLPRDTPVQRCLAAEVEITPAPDPEDVRERRDAWDNRVGAFALHEAHTELEVVARSTVEVTAPPQPTLDAEPTWEQVAAAVRRVEGALVREFVLASHRAGPSPDLRAYAERAFTPGRPVVEALAALTSQVHEDFTFDPVATTVSTPLDEVLERRAGVCQDFAHLTIGCLRSLGLPARYVSGYIETDPPPGRERLQGADASHAWVAVHVPGRGWVDADPTNDLLPGDRHVTLAWGRDYDDVAPLKGVIYSDGTTDELTVEVDVLRLEDDASDG